MCCGAGHASQGGAFAPASPSRAASARARQRAGAAAAFVARAASQSDLRAAEAAWERGQAAEAVTAEEEVARVLAARTHFEVLQLRRDCDGAAARRAYRAAALRVHPDKCSCAGASAAWERVQRAGEALSDDNARAQYLAALAAQAGGAALRRRKTRKDKR